MDGEKRSAQVERLIEWLFPVRATDWTSHDALRIRFTIDMNLLPIHRWNYGPCPA